VEFLLLIGCGVLLLMVLKRLNVAHDYRNALAGISDRLDEMSQRIAALTPEAGPAPAATAPVDSAPPRADNSAPASQPAKSKTENVRVWDYSTPVPKLPDSLPDTAAEPPMAEPPKMAEPPDEPIPEAIPSAISEPAQPQPGAHAPPPGDAPPADTSPPASGRPDFGDFEKRFGTQWVVWVGGIALALGGIFLVRYSIEAGLFGPGLRIIFGAILALVLVGLGELARRREIISGLDKIPTAAHIPSILTAAGTTCAYADVWAAHALYNFLSPATAFILLGLVALATLAAALRHGPALGGLGLVGAYVTPLLVGSQEPSYWALYIYLAVVTAAAYALARIRMWRWLAITAAVASILWMFVGMGDPGHGSLSAHAFYAAAGFALAAYFIVAGLFAGPPAEPGRIDPVSCGVLAAYLLGAYMLTIATVHAPLAMATLFVLMAASVAIAWRSEAALLVVPVAAIFGVLLIGHWVLNWWFVQMVPRGPWSNVFDVKLTGIALHATFAAATAALFGGAGYLAQGRSEQPAFSMLWAMVAVATSVILLIAVYYRITQFDRSFAFAGLALLLAAACAFATEQLWKREPRPGTSEAGAIFATGAVAGLALTLTFALEKGWLTVGLSLMVPGIAWIADRRPLPMLRKLCALLAVLVLARVFWDPRIVGSDVGTTPIINWLLWGYGVPAVSFWIAGRILRRRGDDLPSRSVESAAITFTALTAFLEIRHLMNDGDIYKPGVRLGELGLQVSTGLAMVIGMEHVRARVNSVIHDWGARIFAALAFMGIIALLFPQNPLVTGQAVGGMFFNYILLGYGIPAVLLGALSRVIKSSRPQIYYVAAAVTSIVMMLVYLTLEVRTLFHGSILKGGIMSDAEDYTYSAVWLAFGVALLIVGIVLKSQPARLASAAVVILTIAKVFLHDLAGVQGIFRALSFIGLGLVLMGIGWLYQRLLFPRQPPKAEAGVTPAS
jgi:uncharacterized membrane protein